MINRVVLVGRLVRDVELRKTQSNMSVSSFTIAVDNRQKGSDGNKTTSFIPCTAWNQSADYLSKYAHKGSLVGIDGRLNQRSYEKRDGTKANVVEVVAESVTLLDSKGSSNGNMPKMDEPVDDSPKDDVVDEKNDDVSTTSDVTDDDLPF